VCGCMDESWLGWDTYALSRSMSTWTSGVLTETNCHAAADPSRVATVRPSSCYDAGDCATIWFLNRDM